jgi:hypothetical protein
MAYIFPAPGVAGVQAVLTLSFAGDLVDLVVPAMQDITINNSNDIMTWTQLDSGSKLNVATTATNSLDLNIVLDQTVFFGTGTPGAPVAVNKGIFNLSKDKILTHFALYLGDTSSGGAGKTISGNAYITGLAPSVSADAPVWVSPLTLTVDGDYTVA